MTSTITTPTADEARQLGREAARENLDDSPQGYAQHLDFLDRHRYEAGEWWQNGIVPETPSLQWDEDGELSEEQHEESIEPLKEAFVEGWNAMLDEALAAAERSLPSPEHVVAAELRPLLDRMLREIDSVLYTVIEVVNGCRERDGDPNLRLDEDELIERVAKYTEVDGTLFATAVLAVARSRDDVRSIAKLDEEPATTS